MPKRIAGRHRLLGGLHRSYSGKATKADRKKRQTAHQKRGRGGGPARVTTHDSAAATPMRSRSLRKELGSLGRCGLRGYESVTRADRATREEPPLVRAVRNGFPSLKGSSHTRDHGIQKRKGAVTAVYETPRAPNVGQSNENFQKSSRGSLENSATQSPL